MSEWSDFDDLLQITPPSQADFGADGETLLDGEMPDVSRLMRPVRITYLATLFGTEPRRIEKKLAKCPVIRWEKHKGKEVPVYDFRLACAYLIEPKIDMETWIKSQSSLSLPPMINKAFWEGMRTKMRVMAEAGEYWHTTDVQAVFGRVAMLIKDVSLLWVEDLPDKANLSTENYQALRRMVDELLTEIRKEMMALSEGERTLPVRETIVDELRDSGAVLTWEGDE